MAAVRNGNLSLEDVLNQDIFNTSSHERPPDCLGKVKEALADLAREPRMSKRRVFRRCLCRASSSHDSYLSNSKFNRKCATGDELSN